MLETLLGRKVGMTQIFEKDGRVVPVTVVNVANWYVTQIKNDKNDGYRSLQLGLLKDRYVGIKFSPEWLKDKKRYFACVKEVEVGEGDFSLGQEITLDTVSLEEGVIVQVTGNSRGLGFQGVVKRWNFAGGPSSHGSTFHRKPGSIGHMRSQGEVIKGKKLPGRCGNKQTTVKGLKLVRLNKEAQCVFVKGSLPGKKNTVFLIKKQGI